MNREQLAHVLRAAARIADDPDIIVLGSQSILGTADAEDLPREVTLSVEADIAFIDDPDEVKADEVDGAIGEGSSFHEMYGYYGQGVVIATAVLPEGWRARVVQFDEPGAEPARGLCLEAHDLVVAKLVAGREKDRAFTVELLREGLIDADVLHDRAASLPVPEAVKARVRDSITHCSHRAK